MGQVRQARVSDAAALGRVEVETWQATYAGMLDDRTLVGMSVPRKSAVWSVVARRRAADLRVAEDDEGRLIGFGLCGLQRDPELGCAGEVEMLYVLPDAQGAGVGRQLLTALFDRLLERQLNSALIWVVRQNPSRFFYERLGGKLTFERKMRVGGRDVDVLGYVWRDLTAVQVSKSTR